MRLAIMQPYLFPYLGYFQLLAAVDRFVFYDDVNFIKNGWINRNRLFLSGAIRYFTVPLSGGSPFRAICEVGVQREGPWRRKLLDSIRQSYARAPHVRPVVELASEVLEHDADGIGEMAKRSVMSVARYLALETQVVPSSSAYANRGLHGVERVLDICRRECATDYYNLPGGKELYEPAVFAAQGIRLHFIEPQLPSYPQGGIPFQGGLSILDVLMWNDRSAVSRMLAMPDRSASMPGVMHGSP